MSQILFNYSRNRYFGNHSQRGQILCCKRNRKYGASCSVVRNFGDEQFLNSRGCTHTTTAAASACTWPLLPTKPRSVITNPSYLMVALQLSYAASHYFYFPQAILMPHTWTRPTRQGKEQPLGAAPTRPFLRRFIIVIPIHSVAMLIAASLMSYLFGYI
jgi:hypothetical protein